MIKLGKISVETKAMVPDENGPVVDPLVVPPEKFSLARGFFF